MRRGGVESNLKQRFENQVERGKEVILAIGVLKGSRQDDVCRILVFLVSRPAFLPADRLCRSDRSMWKLSCFLVLALACVVSADIAPFSETVTVSRLIPFFVGELTCPGACCVQLSEWHVRVIRSLEMYGSEDNPPSKSSPGNGEAYIRVTATVSTDGGERVTGHIQPFVIEGDTLDYIGAPDPDGLGTWVCLLLFCSAVPVLA
jgi:hypothetical protein